MSWVKLDDLFAEHPKMERVGDKSFRMHVAALCYCARNLTDGEITPRSVRVLGAIVGTSRPHLNVKELVSAGLWVEKDDGSYEINGYLDYNPPSDEVRAKRADISEKRREAGKRGASRRWQNMANRMAKDVANEDGVSQWQTDSPVPSRPQEQKPSMASPLVENSQRLFFEFSERVGLHSMQRLEALKLGPQLLEEAMRATTLARPANEAAYFTECARRLLVVQKKWRSDQPLEQRLETFVRAAGYIYEDDDLISELHEKGADDVMVKRLVRVAEEVRSAA